MTARVFTNLHRCPVCRGHVDALEEAAMNQPTPGMPPLWVKICGGCGWLFGVPGRDWQEAQAAWNKRPMRDQVATTMRHALGLVDALRARILAALGPIHGPGDDWPVQIMINPGEQREWELLRRALEQYLTPVPQAVYTPPTKQVPRGKKPWYRR